MYEQLTQDIGVLRRLLEDGSEKQLTQDAQTSKGRQPARQLLPLLQMGLVRYKGRPLDYFVPHVGKLVRLRELDLGHTRVCGRGFHRLEALPALEKLTLVFTPIRDDALEPLKAIQTLSLCNVWSCRHLSRQATVDFQAARPDCLLFGLDTLEPHWDRQNADREARR